MDLREVLIGFADWQGYGHAERSAAWLQRLEVNRPEIEAFRAAPKSTIRECAFRRLDIDAAVMFSSSRS